MGECENYEHLVANSGPQAFSKSRPRSKPRVHVFVTLLTIDQVSFGFTLSFRKQAKEPAYDIRASCSHHLQGPRLPVLDTDLTGRVTDVGALLIQRQLTLRK